MILKVTSFVVVAAALAACNTTGNNAMYQSAKQAEKVPEGITLTAQGKKMKMLGTTPFRVAISNSLRDRVGVTGKPDCNLTSAAFTASVAMDKTIQLPSWGKATPPMKLRCDMGKRVFEETVNAINLTEAAYADQAALHFTVGLGLMGAAYTAGQAASRDLEKDLWGYPAQITIDK